MASESVDGLPEAGKDPDGASQTGKHETFEGVYRDYFSSVRNSCRRVLEDCGVADEITQDAFFAAWRVGETQEVRDFAALVWRIAKRRCLNELRRSARVRETGSIESAKIRPMPEFDQDRSFADELSRVLQSLPDKERVAAKLFFIEGYTYREAASKMALGESEIKKVIEYARRKLRKEWRGGGE